MTEKRFTIENEIEMKDNWNINKRCYHFGNGFDAKDCCNMLNELQNENKELKKENEQLKQAIAETEKMVQSTYDELTKLRCIKKNLRRIKSQWDWIMGAVQYD